MLWLSGLEKGFGPQVLFEGVDWQVNPGQRVGLIGPNGAGKSTLMRIIAGELEADKGTVTTSKGLSLGYLPQELHELSDISVRDAARQGLEAVWAVQRELDRVAELLSHEPQSPSLLERYGALQAEFERVGGFEADARVEQATYRYLST